MFMALFANYVMPKDIHAPGFVLQIMVRRWASMVLTMAVSGNNCHPLEELLHPERCLIFCPNTFLSRLCGLQAQME